MEFKIKINEKLLQNINGDIYVFDSMDTAQAWIDAEREEKEREYNEPSLYEIVEA